MKRSVITSIFFLFIVVFTNAQSHYNLQQCIDTALANNIGVRQYGLLSESAAVNLKQARANLLPAISSSLSL